ncbi:hypothetical protein SEA_FIZZLES_40 [Microbacterium phage Fizzles]|nr:hypothetical protein SEA_FIZZLES_40 [Microbacterium phage Fizzles]
MGAPTPRTAARLGQSVQERLEILENRQWVSPERLTGILMTVDDANEAYGSGWFRVGPTTLNGPTASDYIIEQYELDSTSRYQQAWRIGSPATSIFAERWSRSRSPLGVWTAWRLISQPLKSFTPVAASGLTPGNGTLTGVYEVSDGMVSGRITLSLGPTSAITGDLRFDAPLTPNGSMGNRFASDGARIVQASSQAQYDCQVIVTTAGIYVRPRSVVSNFVRLTSLNSTTPITWAAGDVIETTFHYPL